jgi:SLT domain-containing protein
MANGVKDKFNDAHKWAVSATNKMADQVSDKHSWLNKHTNGAVKTMFTGIKKTYKSGYNTVQDYTQTWRDLMTGKWSKLGGDMKKFSKDALSTVGSYFKTGYNTLNKLTGGRLGDMFDKVKSIGGSIVSYFKKLPGRIADGIRNGWHAVESAFVHLGNGMLSGIGKGVNGVIGGIDWILKKVSAPTIKPWKVPQFATGGNAYGLSVVGEKKKHELIKYPDGRMELSPNKATLYNFKQPVKILGGDKTESLLKSIPKFGLGTWLGSAVDFVKGGFSKIADGAEGFWNAVMHPKQLLDTAVDKFTDLTGLKGTILDMAQGTVKTVASDALGWLKNKLTLAGNPSGSGVERWRPYVKRALAMNDLSTSKSMIDRVLRQIKTESGGNPKALGGDDGLSDGRAMGLMQVKPGTFAANHFPGYDNIWAGLDSLLAGLHYAKNRYGAGLSFLGQGHGYANGGIVTTEQMAHIAEGNKAEMVIPLTNQNRALQLMYQALDYFKGNGNSGTQQTQQQTTPDNSQLIQAMQQTNQLISQFMQLFSQTQFGITNQQVYNANKQVSDQNTRIRNLAMGVVN